MSAPRLTIRWVTLLLSCVAGFCDTATYVGGNEIFSAHVTGNFIVFAAQLFSGNSSPESWIKLITFPVFVFAVMTGGWLAKDEKDKYRLLIIEGVILLCCSVAAISISLFSCGDGNIAKYIIVMMTVFALGLQNSFGKLFAKETLGPTTMMTGNVTQASLDLSSLLRNGIKKDSDSLENIKKQSIVIGGFLMGCILGAMLAKLFGLSSLLLPGIAILISYLSNKSKS